jgi:BolA protein
VSVAAALPASERVARLRAALATLRPLDLKIADESHVHAGHAGAQSGHGHFRLRIVSERFAGLGLLARHREVYAALGTLMQTDIHALSLETLTPAEAAQPPSRTHFDYTRIP